MKHHYIQPLLVSIQFTGLEPAMYKQKQDGLSTVPLVQDTYQPRNGLQKWRFNRSDLEHLATMGFFFSCVAACTRVLAKEEIVYCIHPTKWK